MRLYSIFVKWYIVLYILSTVVHVTNCCPSRFIILTDPNDNLLRTAHNKNDREIVRSSYKRTIPDSDINYVQLMTSTKCSPLFDLNYCLNGGQCFSYRIANYTSPSCNCSEGFFGERCESKYLSSAYYMQPKISLANIYGGAIIVGILSTIISATLCCFRPKKVITPPKLEPG